MRMAAYFSKGVIFQWFMLGMRVHDILQLNFHLPIFPTIRSAIIRVNPLVGDAMPLLILSTITGRIRFSNESNSWKHTVPFPVNKYPYRCFFAGIFEIQSPRIHPVDRIIPNKRIQIQPARLAQRVACQPPPKVRRVPACAEIDQARRGVCQLRRE